MKYCTKCGYENSDDLTYCSNCGATLQSSKPEVVIDNSKKRCPKCGYEMKSDAEFCIYCGEQFEKKQSTNQGFKYCTKCGNKLSEYEVYCSKCGYKSGGQDYWTAHKESNKNGLGLAAKVLCIISSSFIGFFALIYICMLFATFEEASQAGMYEVIVPIMIAFIIFLAIGLVSIILTVNLCRKLKNNEKISTGFKICILLFVNLVSGILLLCMDE